MTGPEHYREAERLIAEADRSGILQYKDIHMAQVHATLALAAATALYDADLAGGNDTEYQAWRAAAGTEATS